MSEQNLCELLIERKDLPLSQIVLLDRVQKRLPITDAAIAMLKKENLIAGRKPNFFVEASVAEITDNKASYIKNRAFDDDHYKKMILLFIEKFGFATRKDLDDLIMEKLSVLLTFNQKKNKINNLISTLRKENIIENVGSDTKPQWVIKFREN